MRTKLKKEGHQFTYEKYALHNLGWVRGINSKNDLLLQIGENAVNRIAYIGFSRFFKDVYKESYLLSITDKKGHEDFLDLKRRKNAT